NLAMAVLVSATVALSEGAPSGAPGKSGNGDDGWDDHDDHAPIQAGYAVITPTTTSSTTGVTPTTTSSTTGATTTTSSPTGLVVFETFGLRSTASNGVATQAGVLPPDLTTHAILFADSSGRLSKNLGVVIMNPNSSNVNIVLTFRKNDGSELAKA